MSNAVQLIIKSVSALNTDDNLITYFARKSAPWIFRGHFFYVVMEPSLVKKGVEFKKAK